MRITLGNIDGKAYGLNASEACVYAAIDKCSRGDNAKGWFGSLQSLAEVLPFKMNRSTACRAVAKLLTLGLITKEGESYFAVLQTATETLHTATDVLQTATETLQTATEMLPTAIPLNNPPIYIKENMNEELKEQQRTHTPARDAAEKQQALSNLIESFNALKRAWMSAGGARAEFERRAMPIWTEWGNCSKAKRAKILQNMSLAVMHKRKPDHWRDNPLFFVQDYPEPEPTDWNGVRQDPPEPVEIACYNGHWGMYTLSDIELFNLQTKEQ